MRLAAGLRPDQLGSYSAPQNSSRYKGERKEGKEKNDLGIRRGEGEGKE